MKKATDVIFFFEEHFFFLQRTRFFSQKRSLFSELTRIIVLETYYERLQDEYDDQNATAQFPSPRHYKKINRTHPLLVK